MNLASFHVTHQELSVEELEPLAALDVDAVVAALLDLDAVDEAAVLATCNRFEAYVAGPDPVEARGAALRCVRSLAEGPMPDVDRVDRAVGLASVEHLMRVAAGLESMIVGEDQILGQVKDAYTRSLDAGAAGREVSLAFKKAIATGKRVRTETDINRGAVSVGSAAVTLAERDLGGLAGRRLLVLGAGEVGELVARNLADRALDEVIVASRKVDKAERLARTLDGTSVPYHAYTKVLPDVDVVICATSAPHHVLTERILRDAHGGDAPDRDVLVIDISNPRNVAEDVADVPGVRLRNLDGLERIAEENLDRRRGEVEKAEDLVYQQLVLLSQDLEERRAEGAVRALHEEMRRIREEEYERALQRLNGASDADKEVMHDLVNAAMSKLVAAPTMELKRAAKRGDVETIDALVRLFDLDPEDDA